LYGKGTHGIDVTPALEKLSRITTYANRHEAAIVSPERSGFFAKVFMIAPLNLRGDERAHHRFETDLQVLAKYQNLHFDITQLFPGLGSPLAKFALKRGASLLSLMLTAELNFMQKRTFSKRKLRTYEQGYSSFC